jgi:hypothetical protein
LQWADGTTIENGWRRAIPHVIQQEAILKPDIHPEAHQMTAEAEEANV